MNHMLLAAGAVILATTTQSACAADLATIDCITNGLDTSVRQALLTDAQNAARGKPSGDLDDATKIKLRAISRKCQTQFGWSEKALSASQMYMLTGSRIPAYEAVVREDGVDVTKAETVIRSLPPAQLAGLSAEPMSFDSAQAVMSALIRANIKVGTQAQGAHLGGLAALMSVIERSRAEFAAS